VDSIPDSSRIALESIAAQFGESIVRSKTEEALRKSDEQLVLITENTMDNIAICSFDLNATWLYISPSSKPLFGYEPEELVGKSFFDFVHPADKRKHRALLKNYVLQKAKNLLTGKKRSITEKIEFRFHHKDGSWRTIQSTVNIAGNQLLAVSRDITEYKKAEEQIRLSLQEKEILLKEVHHRVKNNLMIIQSLINLQKANSDSEDFQRYAIELSNRIMTMSLIHEQLYATENFTAVNLENYIETLVQRLTRSLVRHDVSVEKKVQPIDLGIDQSIPLGLILNELLTNAMKHAFPEARRGRIGISVKEKNGRCEVMVKDDGVGLPDQTNFEQPTTLGLKLIYILTEQLDGSVNWTRQNGTSVRIDFPLSSMNA
jgi:PAS domain S-box-containing protein